MDHAVIPSQRSERNDAAQVLELKPPDPERRLPMTRTLFMPTVV
jgi:hypothetical protein